MLSRAIRVDVDVKTDKLDDMSRVDFGKVYTIEHNVKVKSLGKVNRDSLQPLLYQLRAVWANTVGISPQQVFESEQSDATSTVPEWIHAYQALVSSGFSDARARAILTSQPQLLRQVRNDTPAEDQSDEEEEAGTEGEDNESEAGSDD
jgi:hypothetical protein